MSPTTFKREVAAGRIPYKQFGKVNRYRIEDLDQWQQITTVHSGYSDVAKSGTHIYPSRTRNVALSFAKVRAQLTGK
jgi:hypothetical protein